MGQSVYSIVNEFQTCLKHGKPIDSKYKSLKKKKKKWTDEQNDLITKSNKQVLLKRFET